MCPSFPAQLCSAARVAALVSAGTQLLALPLSLVTHAAERHCDQFHLHLHLQLFY